MAGANINIDVSGVDEIKAALEHLQQSAGNLTPVFRDIGEYLQRAHFERFQAQESPEGDPWAPLSPKYQARKKRNKNKILVLDDLLGGTLRYKASAASLLFGTDRVYGATHQFGRDKANIPARPFLGLSRGDEDEVLRLIGEHLAEAL
ncbi:phage virion morphogenesis protein [Geoalkalibacter halelectricus]|uniref:phage virion morphogenesis protein n=1 Tax=Geoalkalibacter halelectricus TaxID=2847045 RepID=UPI003D1D8E49